MNQRLRAQVEAWIDDEVDPAAAGELQALLDEDAEAELADRFRAPLTFGTAGLRGPIRPGPNGMNRTVVRRAAAGLAAWLTAAGHAGQPVVVGYDGRHGSLDFAQDSAAIFAAAGFEALIMPTTLPTPVLAYSVRHLHAAAGVMVTASHNPPADNGYKVYAADGAQIVPPTDTEIEAAIHAVGSSREIPLDPSGVRVLDDDLVAGYVAAVAGLIAADGPRALSIVHTAMHGVGTATLKRVFAAAGFAEPESVPEQRDPDADFPTVAFPNPEEPGALDLAFALAASVGADLIIANDPDADRCAVAVPGSGGAGSEGAGSEGAGSEGAGADGWRMLRGDQVGVLLADALLRKGVRGTYATTIVSSSMLGAMAARAGVGYAETLTGFKWISRAAPDLVYGYEEALGYAVAPELVLDKDGVSAALLVAELAATLKAEGSSLARRLDELAADYGRYATDQLSVRVDDLSLIEAAMRRVRSAPPATLLGVPAAFEELLPATDAVRLRFAGGRVVIRPSGTEPKLKAYLEVIQPDASAEQAAARLTALRTEVAAALGLP
ncbi:phospho-sugar mutase [Jatrophihabitans sp.]|uniref:phospho-sugar mutase n=1 Tax=Jatrophihabitans sp. TaxID=1932789 RepID=UPI0030C6CA88|nr:phosphomannomutase [Jatrophihabitans sp.]